jgi:hypothetical protein
MSDYLQNLLARSLNPSGGVQPRLASLYEPRAAAFAPALPESLDVADEETDQRPPDANEATRPERRPADPSTTLARAERREAATAPQPSPFDASRHSDPARPAEPRAERRTNDDAPHVSRRSSEESAPPSPAPSGVDVRNHASHVEQSGRAFETARDVPAPSASEREPRTKAAEPRVQPAPASRVVEPRVQPAPPPAPARPPQLSEESAHGEAAPTIRVTIGRVDVRAVAGVPQEKRRAPEQPRPALTLEEYLRRRGGGRR